MLLICRQQRRPAGARRAAAGRAGQARQHRRARHTLRRGQEDHQQFQRPRAHRRGVLRPRLQRHAQRRLRRRHQEARPQRLAGLRLRLRRAGDSLLLQQPDETCLSLPPCVVA
jgi:hypothetical protein